MKGIFKIVCMCLLSCLMVSLSYAKPLREGVVMLSYDGETFRNQKNISSPILLYVGAKQCADCKEMWDKTLRDPKVKAYIDKHFITVVSKNADKAVMKRYEIKEFPVVLVLNSNGDVLEKMVGFHDVGETMTVLTAVVGAGA